MTKTLATCMLTCRCQNSTSLAGKTCSQRLPAAGAQEELVPRPAQGQVQRPTLMLQTSSCTHHLQTAVWLQQPARHYNYTATHVICNMCWKALPPCLQVLKVTSLLSISSCQLHQHMCSFSSSAIVSSLQRFRHTNTVMLQETSRTAISVFFILAEVSSSQKLRVILC